MSHSIHVGFLTPNEFSIQMALAVAEKKIVTAKNIHVSDPHKSYVDLCKEHSFNWYPQDADALIETEIAVIVQPKREFATELAFIYTMTRGKIILAMSPGIDCTYVQERVAARTAVVSAPPVQNERGEWEAKLEYSEKFPEYMKAACADIVGSVCKVIS